MIKEIENIMIIEQNYNLLLPLSFKNGKQRINIYQDLRSTKAVMFFFVEAPQENLGFTTLRVQMKT